MGLCSFNAAPYTLNPKPLRSPAVPSPLLRSQLRGLSLEATALNGLWGPRIVVATRVGLP